MRNVGQEPEMRRDLAEVTGKLLAGATNATVTLSEAEEDTALDLANLIAWVRSPVEREYNGEPMFAHDLEVPTRLVKQLVQLVRGGLAIGMGRDDALAMAERVAADTMPPRRLAVLAEVWEHPDTTPADVGRGRNLPWRTADRTLKELHLLGLLDADDPDGRTRYRLAEDVDAGTLAIFARNVRRGVR
jgi:hypothetical protein